MEAKEERALPAVPSDMESEEKPDERVLRDEGCCRKSRETEGGRGEKEGARSRE